jgi:alpha-galactosidase
MTNQYLILSLLLILSVQALAQKSLPVSIGNSLVEIRLNHHSPTLWTYHTKPGVKALSIQAPVFEIDGKNVTASVGTWKSRPARKLRNGVTEHTFEGKLLADSSLRLLVRFRLADDNPVVRFQYELQTSGTHSLTKSKGEDKLSYLSTTLATFPAAKEVRLSEFNHKYHAFTLAEVPLESRYFENRVSVMGPMLVFSDQKQHFLLAYEHGSQYPDRFVEFGLQPDRSLSLRAAKGNYLHGQPLDAGHSYQTLWFEVAGSLGDEEKLAAHYRQFMLRYMTENLESRKPYLFYNTWGRQERVQWAGGKYLTSMNLKTTLEEIEVAHRMGIEVYVIDAGWFLKTGDWQVNTALFPDTLQQVRRKLAQYGMKMGLWFNPIVAAQTSRMLAKNQAYRMSWDGKTSDPSPVWETEESVQLSLVSPYWEDFADELIRLNKELGVSYFKWDAIGQYGSNAAGHYHGTDQNSSQERADSYAFQLPIYMAKVIDKLAKAVPDAIVDFDITEGSRSVGLQFLASGKYFIINNGPYYHDYDLAPVWKTPLPNGNVNIFVQPGPARGWFVRSVLTYDKWIPSVLLLTHYQPDEPRTSQTLNLASLILGQNGIWGEILKTSPEGVAHIRQVLDLYKQVRNDITNSFPVVQGETGSSPEIHEKIGATTGRGVVVVFANSRGSYTYVTKHKVDRSLWKNEGVKVNFDAKGRAVIEADFTGPGAKIIFFGVNPKP